MANIKPFRAIRPRADLADRIAALPYDVYSREEAYRKVQGDPYTFLRIDRPETQFSADYDMYAPEVYERARDMLWEMLDEGQFLEERKEAYYVYELVMNGRSQVGIGACASVDDYENQIIRKHENTRADKEADRIRHVDVCCAQTGPIFLAYRRREGIEKQVHKAMRGRPVYDFTADDGVTHRLWVIDDEAAVERIRQEFAQVETVYIADGHHRCASAVRVSGMRRKSHPDYTGQEEFNYFLSVLFPDDQLMIMDYNRVVKDLNGMTEGEFLAAISEKFRVEPAGGAAYAPTAKGTFGMYLGGRWYKLAAKPEVTAAVSGDPVRSLDVSVLQDYLLGPVLGIGDPRLDKRIDFIGGIRGLGELERRVSEDMTVAFSMYPTSIAELFAVADAGLLMPPKSTWFEPKLRSGIFIHRI